LFFLLFVGSSFSIVFAASPRPLKAIVLVDDDIRMVQMAGNLTDILNEFYDIARVEVVNDYGDLKQVLMLDFTVFIFFMHGSEFGYVDLRVSWSGLAKLIRGSRGQYFIFESCYSRNLKMFDMNGKKVYTPDVDVIDVKVAFLDALYNFKKVLEEIDPVRYERLIEHIRERAVNIFVKNFADLFVRFLIPQEPLSFVFPEKSSFSGPIGYLLDLILSISKEVLREMGRLNDDGTINFGTDTSLEVNFTQSLNFGGGSFPLNVTLELDFIIHNTGDFEASASVSVSKEQKGNIGKLTNVIGTKIEGQGAFGIEGLIVNDPVNRVSIKKVNFEISFQITKSLDLQEILKSVAPGSLGEVIDDVREYFNLEISADIYFGGKIGISYDFETDVTELTISIWVGSSLIVKIAIVEFEAGVKLQFDVTFSPYGNTFTVTFTAFAKASVDLYLATLHFEGSFEIKWSAGPDERAGTQMNLDDDGDGLPNDYESTIGTDPNNPDSDGDGIPDGIEINEYCTDPLNNDTDGDGLLDGFERNWFESLGYDPRSDVDGDGISNILDEDSDNDYLSDGEEYILGSNPVIRDSDGDGLIDGLEQRNGTNPALSDTDDDGLPDLEEILMGLDPKIEDTDGDKLRDGDEVYIYNTNPFEIDTDGDKLSDYDELFLYNTDPLCNDTDGDGISDGDEIGFATSPLNDDSDGDNLSDYLEIYGWNIFVINDSSGRRKQIHVTSDPTDKDTDDDGVIDGLEYVNGSNPRNNDTDSDGISDKTELNGFYYDGVNFVKTDPANWDTDGDGLSDGYEREHSTNPADNDTDDDHLSDGFEKSIKTNATDPDSDDDGISDGDEFDMLNDTYGVDPNTTDSDNDGVKDILDSDADNDGLSDGEEVFTYFTNPLVKDTDNDGADDYTELFTKKTDPLNPDTDGDGLLDGFINNPWSVGELGEGNVGTNPLINDTDGDGLLDSWEVELSSTPPYFVKITDPLNPDTDFDGLLDGHEYQLGTLPNKMDTDSDNISDGFEVNGFNITYPNGLEIGPFYTDPLDNDTDHDGLSDGLEANILYTSPISPDTDGDGLTDYAEVNNYFTNPLDPDTDNDGLTDYEEIFQWNWDTLRKSEEELAQGPPMYRNETKIPEELPPEEKKQMPFSYFTYSVARFKYRITPFRGMYYTDPLDNDTDDDGLLDGEEKQYATNPLNNDTDYDGLLDGEEIKLYGTDPRISDCDRDGLLDGDEVNYYNTLPLDNDSDDDGLTDFEEVRFWLTNATKNDTDNDNLLDGEEVHGVLAWVYNRSAGKFVYTNITTDPLDNDTDDDGLLDGDEVLFYHTNPFSADSDGDELLDHDEIFVYGTNATYFDTDYDGLIDGLEIYITSTDPLDPDEDNDGLPDGKMFDYDNDTLSDYDEIYTYGTLITSPDTDNDGMPDAWEALYQLTDPRNYDAYNDPDYDNLMNIEELIYRTSPDLNDTDGDGLLDGEEVFVVGTDPTNVDTDGDNLSDYEEVVYGTDPLDPDISPPNIYIVSDVPTSIRGDEELIIYAKVIDPAPIDVVLLEYTVGEISINVTMARINSTHYTAVLTNLPIAENITIIIFAADKSGNWNKTETLSIYVKDIYGPMIELVNISPVNPIEGENITIDISVSDLVGVDLVILSYSYGSSWHNVSMSHISGNIYRGKIVNVNGSTLYTIKIYAKDADDNWSVSQLGEIYVSQREKRGILDLMSLGVGILIGVAAFATIYVALQKSRKRKRK